MNKIMGGEKIFITVPFDELFLTEGVPLECRVKTSLDIDYFDTSCHIDSQDSNSFSFSIDAPCNGNEGCPAGGTSYSLKLISGVRNPTWKQLHKINSIEI